MCTNRYTKRQNIEEDVGLEPTTVLPATTFQESLLIQPDVFPFYFIQYVNELFYKITTAVLCNQMYLKKRLESFILIRVLI